MATVGHTTIGFLPDLFDLGHTHVVWDTVLQAPVQDPYIGGTNVYGTSDVFQDSAGNTYRVSIPDGTVVALYGTLNPPASQLPQPTGNQQPHDGRTGGNSGATSPNNPASPTNPANRQQLPPGAQTGAAAAGALGGLSQALGKPFRVSNYVVPTWSVLAGLGGAAFFLTRKKHR